MLFMLTIIVAADLGLAGFCILGTYAGLIGEFFYYIFTENKQYISDRLPRVFYFRGSKDNSSLRWYFVLVYRDVFATFKFRKFGLKRVLPKLLDVGILSTHFPKPTTKLPFL